jgi:hypothetical protein
MHLGEIFSLLYEKFGEVTITSTYGSKEETDEDIPQGFRSIDHKKELETMIRAEATHVAVLSQRDGNVCESCENLDKKGLIPIKEAIENQILPHKNCTNDFCRCTYLPRRKK